MSQYSLCKGLKFNFYS